jgi:molybdopterin converting factor small subunit
MNVQIDFMGVIANITRTKKLALDFDDAPTLSELLTELERRYGDEFSARIYRNASAPRRLQTSTRIFINGNVVDDRALESSLPSASEPGSSAKILVYFLPAACGG